MPNHNLESAGYVRSARRPILGAGRRIMARLASRLPVPDPSADVTSRPAIPTSRITRSASRLFDRLERPDLATSLARSGAERANADDRLELSIGLLLAGRRDVRNEQFLGTVEGSVGAPGAAIRVLSSVPPTPRSEHVRARAQVALGRALDVRRELDPSGADDALHIEVLESMEKQQGALSTSETEELLVRLRRVLASRPNDESLRCRLTARLIATNQFDVAREVQAGPSPLLDRTPCEVEMAEATAVGQHRSARRIKLDIAEAVAQRTPSRHDPLRMHVDWIRASSFRFGSRVALDRVEERWPLIATHTERVVREKLRADLGLALGDPLPHQRFRDNLDSATPRAQQRFDSLVRGRRVLVVGPAAANRPSALDFAEADVIVTTRRRNTIDSTVGIDAIVYVADSSAQLDRDELRASLSLHPSDMLVLRPSILAAPGPWFAGHDQVRVMQAEDTNTFLGTRFAVQRILYDLLAHAPASINITGLDFFIGSDKYIAGYQKAHIEVDENRRLRLPDVNASHDLAWDHAFTKSLRDAGLIRSPQVIDRLLDLPTARYLSLVDEFRGSLTSDQAVHSLIA